MSVYSDFRFLATKDIRHRRLSYIPDIWYKKFEVMVEYDKNKKPLSGVVLKEQICPIDPTADYRIYLWASNTELGYDALVPAFDALILRLRTHMVTLGKKKLWGQVPKYAIHLTTYLKSLGASAKCDETNGDDVEIMSDERTKDFSNYIFYICDDRDTVANFVAAKGA